MIKIHVDGRIIDLEEIDILDLSKITHMYFVEHMKDIDKTSLEGLNVVILDSEEECSSCFKKENEYLLDMETIPNITKEVQDNLFKHKTHLLYSKSMDTEETLTEVYLSSGVREIISKLSILNNKIQRFLQQDKSRKAYTLNTSEIREDLLSIAYEYNEYRDSYFILKNTKNSKYNKLLEEYANLDDTLNEVLNKIERLDAIDSKNTENNQEKLFYFYDTLLKINNQAQKEKSSRGYTSLLKKTSKLEKDLREFAKDLTDRELVDMEIGLYLNNLTEINKNTIKGLEEKMSGYSKSEIKAIIEVVTKIEGTGTELRKRLEEYSKEQGYDEVFVLEIDEELDDEEEYEEIMSEYSNIVETEEVEEGTNALNTLQKLSAKLNSKLGSSETSFLSKLYSKNPPELNSSEMFVDDREERKQKLVKRLQDISELIDSEEYEEFNLVETETLDKTVISLKLEKKKKD